jgi:hypothetical protein
MVLKWMRRVLPLAAVALAAGCNLGGEVTLAPSTAVPAAEQVHATPAERYVNTEGKFSLVLPVGWLELGPLAMTLPETGAGYSLYVLGSAPTESGGPGASIIVIADAAQMTLEQFAASQCSTCPAHSPEAVTLGTVPTERLLIGGGAVPFEKSWFFFEHHGRRIGLAIHDPETLEPLDEVLATLRLEAE